MDDFDHWIKESRLEFMKDKTSFVFQNQNLADVEKAFLEQKIVYLEACVKGLIDAVHNLSITNNSHQEIFLKIFESINLRES